MPDTACETFRAAIATAFKSPEPVDVPDEQLLHVHGCESCLEWIDAFVPEGLTDGEAGDRLMALFTKIDALARTDLPPDATMQALHAERDRREAEVEAAVTGFIARHPELDPTSHGIPMERFEPIIFFTAVDAVGMLIRRIVRRGVHEPAFYGLRDDGEVFIGSATAVPAAGVRREIREFIVNHRIVPDDEKVEDLGEALRLEAAWNDEETCAKLAAWIVRAVRLKPDLMRDFRMIGTSTGDPRVILLEPVRSKDVNGDPLASWNE